MVKKLALSLAVFVIIIVICGAYFPSIAYLAARMGIEVADGTIGDIRIDPKSRWVLVASDNSFLAPFLANDRRHFVMLASIDFPWPGIKQIIVFSPLKDGFEVSSSWKSTIASWGQIYEIPSPETSQYVHYVDVANRLLVTTSRNSNIEGISIVHRDKKLQRDKTRE